MCDFFLIQTCCPVNLRHQSACNRQGLLHTQNTCTCGSLSLANTEIQTLLTTHMLDKRSDMTPYTGYLTTANDVNFCQAYVNICEKLLDHLQAPGSSRAVSGCTSGSSGTNSSGLAHWHGQCTAGSLDVSTVVADHIYDKLVQSNVLGLFVLAPQQGNVSAAGTVGTASVGKSLSV